MTRSMWIRKSLFACAVVWIAAACDQGPRELVSGEDPCRYCRMTIDDVRFGAMVKTDKGKIETFDSIECLAAFVGSLPASMKPQGVWVADFSQPNRWIAVDSARFVQTSTLTSPMGRELAAFEPTRSDAELARVYGGRVLDWTSVQALVLSQPFAPSGASKVTRNSGAVASTAHIH
jgi:copper chaperone NosL